MVSSSADKKPSTQWRYKKKATLYLSKSNRLMHMGFSQFQALTVLLDEATLPAGSMLQIFASTPITTDTATGIVMPPQKLPDLHVCFNQKKLGLRIMEFEGPNCDGDGSRQGNIKPAADPGLMSWHCVVALDHALKTMNIRDGLDHFGCRRPLKWPAKLGIHYNSSIISASRHLPKTLEALDASGLPKMFQHVSQVVSRWLQELGSPSKPPSRAQQNIPRDMGLRVEKL